jgi:sRNA-binding carbon storage regulator CsrA
MGLVITRSVGETFWVGDSRYVVVVIGRSSGCTLLARDGTTIEVNQDSQAALGEVTKVSEGLRTQSTKTRLVIDAPRSIKIWRGEVREKSSEVDDSQTELALLAPVPYRHLPSALDSCTNYGKVAFGSNAWQLFKQLDEKRGDFECPVLLYASHDKALFPPRATWKATYVRQVPARAGKYPHDMNHRPSSAIDDSGWTIFWELTNLRPLERDEEILIKGLTGFRSQKTYAEAFRPEGPVLVENPYVVSS